MTKTKWNPIKVGILATTVLAPAAQAEITFNGFASIRATAADADGPSGSPSIALKGDGDISFKDESVFAIQASSDLGDGFSATVQLLAEGSEDFDVEAEWAYLSYELNDSHTLSAGRFANPIFYQSQYEKVGYAHNYARLPRAVYVGFDFSTIEGIALDSTFFIGDNTLTTKLLYGNWDGNLFFGATGQDESFGIKDVISVNATLSGDWWNIFVGGFTTELEGGSLDNAIYGLYQTAVEGIPNDPANPGLIGAGLVTAQEAQAFRDALLWEGRDGLYWFAGLNAEYNNMIVEFEYADYKVEDSWDAPNQAFYVALGYRFDTTVVTLHYEDNSQDIDTTFLNDVNNAILFGLGADLQNSQATEFDAWGINIRYDFHPSAAFKFSYVTGDHTSADIQDYDVIRAGVDVVF